MNLAADAVRVWRGFKAPTLSLGSFYDLLGGVFIPATVEMQANAGLVGYLPSIPAGMPGKPDSVPDETAILFWGSQDAYRRGFQRLAVRTYTLTHAAVYAPGSGADFPVPFEGWLQANQPYYLNSEPADWMRGISHHVLGSRPSAVTPMQFRANLAAALPSDERPTAILCAADDYFVGWELTADDSPQLRQLLEHCDWQWSTVQAEQTLPAGLWDEWAGIPIGAGTSLNFQFTRLGDS